MRIHPRHRETRSGFTLVELMIVILIVLLLLAMATSAVLRFRNTGPYTATVMNLQKIKAALDTQWKAVRDQAQKEPINSTQLAAIVAELGLPAGTTASNTRVREAYVQKRLRQSFPTSFSEALAPAAGVLSAYPTYNQYLTSKFGASASSAGSPESQQAICLMMILQRGPSNPGITPDQLTTSAALRLPVIVGASTIEDFGCVDAWGRALRFTRDGNGANSFVPAILSTGPNGQFEGAWRPNADSSDDVSTLGL